jgi:hypothetical protein
VPRHALPPWLRALNRVAAASHRLARLAAAVRDESALAWTAPAARANLTASLFDRAPTYAPGGATFALGLFDWERELLAPPFPQRGRILVGGAGGGREAVALLERGYHVIAFDPARELVRRGAPVVAAAGGALIAASYADVIRQAAGDSTPLTPLLGTPVDGVLLGWGSFSLVVSDGERVALLRAVRAIAPAAPVALSFDEHSESDPAESGVARARAALRRLYGRRGAPGYSGERMRYAPWAGILRESTAPEVETVARAAGYEVAKHGSAPGRMLLMPVAGATDSA